MQSTPTVGETLIDILGSHGVEVVFGIPGVHTVELYRGLAGSRIRHVTPRHEQAAGFMADGYARVSGKPGVCLVITGPGLTNTLTAMAQARQDSVPMLVISGVNKRATLGHGRGDLHELPDQHALAASIALWSHTLLDPTDLPDVIARAFATFASSRPGPVHIEIPVDVMGLPLTVAPSEPKHPARPAAGQVDIAHAARLLNEARRPVILAGGGARHCDAELRVIAEMLDAPLVTTTNARGLLAGHGLEVPGSPSLPAVRDLVADADAVLALGTEFGPTDYDMYADDGFPQLSKLIRIDIDAMQLARAPASHLAILSDTRSALDSLAGLLAKASRNGHQRAQQARERAVAGLDDKVRSEVALLKSLFTAFPDAIIVGDSTQLVYAGNLYCDAARPSSWFNAATGFGALGYGPPAAIGAALAAPDRPVFCIVGDGGMQFVLAELGSAMDEKTPVVFIVWNNEGYQEIENYMVSVSITPEGVRPSPPDFMAVAQAYGLHAQRVDGTEDLGEVISAALASGRAALIDVRVA